VQKPDNLEKLRETVVTYFETSTGAEGKLKKFSGARLHGTATWILKESEYCSWLKNGSPLLWVSGPPGAGKTHISSFIIEELRKTVEDAPRSSVAHFFIRYAEKETRSLKNALASAIIRISETDEVYCKHAAAEVADLKKEAAKLDDADLGTIWQRFFLDQYSSSSDAKLYLVIDGLDEADVDERNLFLDLIDQLGNTGPVGIQVILVGQPSLDDAVTHLTTTRVHQIFVSSAKNSKDLAHFLNEKLDSDRNIRRRLWWKDIREHVVSVLLENAKGENQ
jgi:Cdc6-like AAA superfamily ATPase